MQYSCSGIRQIQLEILSRAELGKVSKNGWILDLLEILYNPKNTNDCKQTSAHHHHILCDITILLKRQLANYISLNTENSENKQINILHSAYIQHINSKT